MCCRPISIPHVVEVGQPLVNFQTWPVEASKALKVFSQPLRKWSYVRSIICFKNHQNIVNILNWKIWPQFTHIKLRLHSHGNVVRNGGRVYKTLNLRFEATLINFRFKDKWYTLWWHTLLSRLLSICSAEKNVYAIWVTKLQSCKPLFKKINILPLSCLYNL